MTALRSARRQIDDGGWFNNELHETRTTEAAGLQTVKSCSVHLLWTWTTSTGRCWCPF